MYTFGGLLEGLPVLRGSCAHRHILLTQSIEKQMGQAESGGIQAHASYVPLHHPPSTRTKGTP